MNLFKDPSGPDHGVRNPEGFDAEGRLDHQWVTRWLDDVGLPQYKVTLSANVKVSGFVSCGVIMISFHNFSFLLICILVEF